MKNRYEKTLIGVRNWQQPTNDHNGLKEFCIKQLEESIQWDCGSVDDYLKPVIKPDAKKWIQDKVNSCLRDIEYQAKHHREEVERVGQRTKWVQDLRESLTRF